MTVHKSKGLQAKVVFLLCVDKGLYGFPSEIEDPFIFEPAMYGKLNNKEEEERRLFYVAITRSKEDVIIYTQKENESKFIYIS
jgi:DNA helicase-4